jgi:hypothetical protein
MLTEYYRANLLQALRYLGTRDSKEQYEIWKDHFSLSAIANHGIPKWLLQQSGQTHAVFEEFTECLWSKNRLPDWLHATLETRDINPADWGLEQ